MRFLCEALQRVRCEALRHASGAAGRDRRGVVLRERHRQRMCVDKVPWKVTIRESKAMGLWCICGFRAVFERRLLTRRPARIRRRPKNSAILARHCRTVPGVPQLARCHMWPAGPRCTAVFRMIESTADSTASSNAS